MNRFKNVVFLVLLSLSFSVLAWQPTKPIEVIVPFPAGSGNDLAIRPLAAAVEKNTGVQFLIVNKPGASGTIGTTALANKPNDGYHIGVLSMGATAASDYIVLARLNSQPYNVNSFEYATALAQAPLVVIANKNDPISTPEGFKNILLYDKTVSFAGAGGVSTLASESIIFYTQALKSNSSMPRIEYKGAAEAIADVMGGHIRFAVVPLPTVYANYKAGNIKIIGVTQQNKIKDSELKTFESVNKNINITVVWGIALPKNTPSEVLNWYAKAFKEAQNDPNVKESFAKNRFFSVDGLQTPKTFTDYVMKENKQHATVINTIIKNEKIK